MRRTSPLLLTTVLSLTAAGCGDGDRPDRPAARPSATPAATATATPVASRPAGTVTVYTSLPLRGEIREEGRAIRAGARVALARAGGRAGAFRVRLRSLDGVDRSGEYTPGVVRRNARRAVRDESAVGYIGEFNSGATTISLPRLNRARLAQVSPSNTDVALTRKGPATKRQEPKRYQPTGKRTFVRVIPADHLQGAAVAQLAKELGAREAGIVRDGTPYGRNLGGLAAKELRKRGLKVATRATLSEGGGNGRSIVRRLKRAKVQALIYAGVDGRGAARLFNAAHKALPEAQLVAGDGVATKAFAKGLRGPAEEVSRITLPTLDALAYPDAAQPIFTEVEGRIGGREASGYALFGYEAMALLLEAIERAGPRGDDRAAVAARLTEPRGRRSVLGRYEIDARGDTTLPVYGVFKAEFGGFNFDRPIDSSKG